MHVAVLDLGTNTFNLVVARRMGESGFEIVHNSKLPVKLGEGGINQGHIAESAFERGIKAIENHYATICKFNVERILAFGTSALRSAQNCPAFLARIKQLTNIDISIISGEREAELIYLGVRQTFAMNSQKYLILDIGGGSNEFIIADGKEIFWKKSYKLGIARLLEMFSPSDPLKQDEIIKINQYFEQELQELFTEVSRHKVNKLLGASGSFETFVSMIEQLDIENEMQDALHPHSKPITMEQFNILHSRLIRSSTAERRKMKGLETMRIEMIVLASLFVKFIVEKLDLTQIIQSNFALKEGAIYELINDERHGTNISD